MDGLIILILFACIIVIFIAYLLASEFQHIAEMKGHPEKKYFWWCFLYPLAGVFMVIALPDRGKNAADQQTVNDELPDL